MRGVPRLRCGGYTGDRDAGWSSQVARRAHNPEVAGSNPAPATRKGPAKQIDYLPPVDVTFFEYLRALITADLDVVAEDRLKYRVAFVEAFRKHGIYPADLGPEASEDTPRTLSVDTLRWRGIDQTRLKPSLAKAIKAEYGEIVDQLRRFAAETAHLVDRRRLFDTARRERLALHGRLKQAFANVPAFAEQLGVDPAVKFEVHELHAAMRFERTGRAVPQLIARLTQQVPLIGTIGGTFHGGSTLVIDLAALEVKVLHSQAGEQRHAPEAHAGVPRRRHGGPLRRLLLAAEGGEPFGLLHALGEHV